MKTQSCPKKSRKFFENHRALVQNWQLSLTLFPITLPFILSYYTGITILDMIVNHNNCIIVQTLLVGIDFLGCLLFMFWYRKGQEILSLGIVGMLLCLEVQIALMTDLSADRSISLRGTLKKTSIFKDIVQIGGREVKKLKRNDFFSKSWRGRGSQNILSKIEVLYFVWFITQSGPTKGLSVFLSVALTLRK